MDTTVDEVWHQGRRFVNVDRAAEMVGLTIHAVYKAVREESLEAWRILGVKAIPVDALEARWPERLNE